MKHLKTPEAKGAGSARAPDAPAQCEARRISSTRDFCSPPLLSTNPACPQAPAPGWCGQRLGLQTPPSASKALCLAVTLILKCAYFIFKGKPHLVGIRA